MSSDDAPLRAVVADTEHGAPRTTSTLVASLRARLSALRAMSGAQAVGSLVAGYAQLGHEVARTVEGGRLAAALRAGRPGANGEIVWSALGVDVMTQVPPSPVLDHLRNDLALLLADDLDAALHTAAPLSTQEGDRDVEAVPADSVDYLVGMWAFSRELVAAVEALAAPTARADNVVEGQGPAAIDGSLLR